MSSEAQSPAGPAAEVRPYSQGRRTGYSLLWAAWTVVLTIGGFVALANGSVFAGLIGLTLAALALRYVWRIWTWQAKRLIFFIVF
ncbi:hypothetical protein QRX60_15245 [Amycolatopsis mongoliensis]|uniref:Uncharacterized protein n=1 Tax=Amycolatopsis mongoliensis TaxID=715475 RepID=A0A9Y2JVV0_9PSEU|nr:hypothetical protein [Amycolatopsis sp. 4-36]WIY05123.1 hypothetical protein QRX60_15245 [Amycolatopsis sp. 4-36]